jgi:hypothetical protein
MDSFLSGLIPLYCKAEALAIAHQQSQVFGQPYYIVRYPASTPSSASPGPSATSSQRYGPAMTPGASSAVTRDGRN